VINYYIQFRTVKRIALIRGKGIAEVKILTAVPQEEYHILVAAERSLIQDSACHLLHADLLLGLLFNPEKGGEMFPRNIVGLLPN
jgi:hypothetical protein